MAQNRGRKPEDNAPSDEGTADDVLGGRAEILGEVAGDQAANADETRALGDPAPEWAGDGSAPEVMTSRDQRRAGVLDKLRNQAAPGGLAERTEQASAVQVVGEATAWLDNTLREAARAMDSGAGQAVEEIVARIKDATTLEDILADDAVTDAADILDVPVQVWGFKVNTSDFQQGMAGYMLIKATRISDKADLLISCGAYKVQAQLLRMGMLQMFPAEVKFVKKAEATRSGFFPIQLVKA